MNLQDYDVNFMYPTNFNTVHISNKTFTKNRDNITDDYWYLVNAHYTKMRNLESL